MAKVRLRYDTIEEIALYQNESLIEIGALINKLSLIEKLHEGKRLIVDTRTGIDGMNVLSIESVREETEEERQKRLEWSHKSKIAAFKQHLINKKEYHDVSSSITDEELTDVISSRIHDHLQKSDICQLNPDGKIVSGITKGLIKRYRKFDDFYCPCKVVPPDLTDKSTVCPCTSHEHEIAENGKCHCGLYVKK